MFKRGIGLGLLCIASHAYSGNIVVTTTADNDNETTQCSLRHAIEYINQGMPETAYKGCGGKDSTAKIILQANQEYLLNRQVRILKNVEFASEYTTNVTDTDTVIGKKNAIIKMTGKDRLFQIEKEAATNVDTTPLAMLKVIFTEITLKGCGQSICADQGGLIYNKETLFINNSQLLNGIARLGGAIYNAGTNLANTEQSKVTIGSSLIQGNRAERGGAIYSEIPAYFIGQSVIRDNEVTAANGSILDTENQFSEDALTTSSSSVISFGLVNSTVFNNKGYVIKVFDGMKVNNITMILNSMGLIVNAPKKLGFVANSILAQNGTQDCTIQAGGEELQISNNLYSVGCKGYKSNELGNTQLIAGTTTEGKCDYNSNGILCPFSEAKTIALGYFLPRILASYNALSDSPIVNHGISAQDRANKVLSCPNLDQRMKNRDANTELCDRGAIELIVDNSNITTKGKDILFNEVAEFSIADQLLDGELVVAAQCRLIFKRDLDDNGQPWRNGCLKVTQMNDTPSKGTITISPDGDVVYIPNGKWQGSDEFRMNVVISTTRFNNSDNPYISIRTNIVQRKPDDFKNSKVKTSGGSLGIFSLIGLVGLAGYRRIKYK